MSYTVDLIVGSLPSDDKEAWKQIEALRETYYNDDRKKAEALVALHSVLTARYPCLCSYSEDDPMMDESPWTDGPMLGNFAHEMGMLAISFTRADEVVPFIIKEANALGISVADGQSEDIYRPGSSSAPKVTNRRWWRFWE